MVDWDIICSPIQYGGMGVHNLVCFNHTLLGKWLLRFGVDKRSFWRLLVALKYGEDIGQWTSLDVRGPYGVGLWKGLRRGGGVI